jgi:hypothetical protein
MIDQITANIIDRIDKNMHALFAPDVVEELCDNIPAPYVSLDLETYEPRPLHVFTWGTARDFDVSRGLTAGFYNIGFHVYVTIVASSSTSEEAARIANNYQAIAIQMTLADPTLGGAAYEVMVPQVQEAQSWFDQDGKRHAGYLLDYEVHVMVQTSKTIKQILKGLEYE